jgi:two-component system phosphate regulon sensor histidine kinase PhoR
VKGLALRGAAVCCAAAVGGLGAGLLIAHNGANIPTGLLIAVALAILGVALGIITFANATRTVRAVSDAADRFAAGELGERVMIASAATGDLTRHFNQMAVRVQRVVESTNAEHARLEAVFDASTDAMIALSADTTVRLLNRSALSLLTTGRSESIGRPFIETARDYELDALVRRVIAGGTTETSVITLGPRRIPLRAAAVPISAGDWSVLLILTDLTEFQRVDQVRRDFLTNVSHELRTPLAAIQALVETIENGAVEPGEETQAFVRRIHQQVQRLTSLVNELLDLSRIESGALALAPEPVDLAQVVAEATSLLQVKLEQTGVRIEGPPDPGLVAEADRPSILRVVTNLLDNAIKYSPRGSTIHAATADEGDLVSLTVTDEGPGIPEADLDRVFERFYTGDASRATTGVGLGLAIVKHLVRAHGGTATASSKPGQGATFTVKLPKVFVGSERIAPRTRREPTAPNR